MPPPIKAAPSKPVRYEPPVLRCPDPAPAYKRCKAAPRPPGDKGLDHPDHPDHVAHGEEAAAAAPSAVVEAARRLAVGEAAPQQDGRGYVDAVEDDQMPDAVQDGAAAAEELDAFAARAFQLTELGEMHIANCCYNLCDVLAEEPAAQYGSRAELYNAAAEVFQFQAVVLEHQRAEHGVECPAPPRGIHNISSEFTRSLGDIRNAFFPPEEQD